MGLHDINLSTCSPIHPFPYSSLPLPFLFTSTSFPLLFLFPSLPLLFLFPSSSLPLPFLFFYLLFQSSSLPFLFPSVIRLTLPTVNLFISILSFFLYSQGLLYFINVLKGLMLVGVISSDSPLIEGHALLFKPCSDK